MMSEPNLTFNDLVDLVVGTIVEPWNLPVFPEKEHGLIYSKNNVIWTLNLTLDEERKCIIHLEVRRISSVNALKLTQRLQEQFPLLRFSVGDNQCSFEIGTDATHDILEEEKRREDSPYRVVLD